MIPPSRCPRCPGEPVRSALALTALMLLVTTLPAAAGDVMVIQRNKAFSAPEVTLKAGDRIRFVNADTVTHNVFSGTPGFEFEIRTQQPGRSGAVGFEVPGRLLVECAIHPWMRLRVDVGPK